MMVREIDYDIYNQYGTSEVKVTIQIGNYRGNLLLKVDSRDRGLAIMECIDDTIYMVYPNIESDCEFELINTEEELDVEFKINLKSKWGKRLEIRENLNAIRKNDYGNRNYRIYSKRRASHK